MANTSRRRFLEILTTSGAVGLIAPGKLLAQQKEEPAKAEAPAATVLPLVDSLPVLQCPLPTGITVVWAVGKPAAGFVEFGTDPNALDQTAFGEVFGQKPYHDRVLQVRIEGLKAGTRYFYRTVTRSFKFRTAYKFEQGEPEYSDIFSFETPAQNKKESSFSVINDTHENQETLARLSKKLNQIDADYTVWNGDLVNSYTSANQAVDAVLRPAGTFASSKPLLFVPGNHDYRGAWSRNNTIILPTWNHPAPEDRAFGRNFAVRNGSLALIGLDTGEDKPDYRKEWAGLARYEPYRIAQRDWLERALQSKAIATAPFVVVFCHIPLYNPQPTANGGDRPDGYADYQKQAADLWSPLFEKHHVQAVVVAHTHKFSYEPARSSRCWAQICGGGPGHEGDLTVIHGHATANTLTMVVDELNTGKELGKWEFKKR